MIKDIIDIIKNKKYHLEKRKTKTMSSLHEKHKNDIHIYGISNLERMGVERPLKGHSKPKWMCASKQYGEGAFYHKNLSNSAYYTKYSRPQTTKILQRRSSWWFPTTFLATKYFSFVFFTFLLPIDHGYMIWVFGHKT